MKELHTPHLDKVQLDASREIADFPDHLIYRNLMYFNRFQKSIYKIGKYEEVSDEELEIMLIAMWLFGMNYADFEIKFKKSDFVTERTEDLLSAEKDYLKKIDYPKEKRDKVLSILENVFYTFPPISKGPLDCICIDAILNDFAGKKGKKHLKKSYEELLLKGVEVSRKSWFDFVLDRLSSTECYTKYGKEFIQPKLTETLLLVQKEKKDLQKREDIALKKELDISDVELKNLKKSLSSAKGRDERGIQTLFRTTSKNHYTLNQMVDNKASIMITVNSIILSLVIGGVLGKDDFLHNVKLIPPTFLSVTSLISIFYAILAIMPNKTQGEFTEEEIRNKSGNLLYFGNFHDMKLRDFEWGMSEMINDGNFLYSSMIKDLYFLGETLDRKYKLIRKSLYVFLFGLGFSIILSLIIRTCFHMH